MTQNISTLVWTDSPLKNPLAIYAVDFAVDISWQWTNLRGYKDLVELRAQYVRVDNLDSNQFINVYFDNVRYPVNAFQLLTIPIPPGALKCTIEGDASAPLACEVTFSIDDISQADTYNFKEIQSSGTEGVLWPVFYKAGPWNFIASDDHTIQSFTIAAPIAVTLPDPTTVSNGWTIQIWNSQASTSNITLSVAGGVATVDGAASLALAPNSKTWLVLDGANGFTVVKVTSLNPAIQIFTVNGNWTPSLPAQTLDYIEVEVIGGGAAGGGAPATGAGQGGAGGGGGAGGYSFKKILAAALNLAGETVTIGAAGIGVSGGTGGAGGTSSFGAHCSATGGAGGASGGPAANSVPVAGGIGGSGAGGSFNEDGGTGQYGFRSQASSAGGEGGDSFYCGGASAPVTGGGSNGINGQSHGAGGSGGANGVSQAARTGGNGVAGIIIVREYYK